MDRLLIISEKWCDLNPNSTRSTSHTTIYKTALASGCFKEIQHIFLEDIYTENPRRHIDDYLIDNQSKLDADLIVVSYIGNHPCNPTSRSLSRFKGKKVFIWPDTGWDWLLDAMSRTNLCACFHLSYDTYNTNWINERISPKRMYLLGTPQDPELFYPDKDKDYLFMFSGTIYPSRTKYYEKLKEVSNLGMLRGFLHTGQRVDNITVEEYAKNLRKSYIVINIPTSTNDTITIKGRVFEAMASNCTLLELKNNETSKMFRPEEHYMEYSDENELVHKLTGLYVRNLQEIATAGHEFYMKNYSSIPYWNKVIELTKKPTMLW